MLQTWVIEGMAMYGTEQAGRYEAFTYKVQEMWKPQALSRLSRFLEDQAKARDETLVQYYETKVYTEEGEPTKINSGLYVLCTEYKFVKIVRREGQWRLAIDVPDHEGAVMIWREVASLPLTAPDETTDRWFLEKLKLFKQQGEHHVD